MRSKELDLENHDSDKIKLGYLDVYDPILERWSIRKLSFWRLESEKGVLFNCGATIFLKVVLLGLI